MEMCGRFWGQADRLVLSAITKTSKMSKLLSRPIHKRRQKYQMVANKASSQFWLFSAPFVNNATSSIEFEDLKTSCFVARLN